MRETHTYEKFGNLSTREIITSIRPSAPLENQCKMSNFLASVGACIMVNWQLSKQGIGWPVAHDRIVGSGANSSRSRFFLKFSADQLLAFNNNIDHTHNCYAFQLHVSPLKLSIDLWISSRWFDVLCLKNA